CFKKTEVVQSYMESYRVIPKKINIGNSSEYKVFIDKYEPMNSLAFWFVDQPNVKYTLNTNRIISDISKAPVIDEMVYAIKTHHIGDCEQVSYDASGILFSSSDFILEAGATIQGYNLFITKSSIYVKNILPSNNIYDLSLKSLVQYFGELQSYKQHTDFLDFSQYYRKVSNPNSACYIATMAYQDISHPQVDYLRTVRDEVLSKYSIGRKFINYYYKYSPMAVERLSNHHNVNRFIRKGLDALIAMLKRFVYKGH
ncbi:hypothetical protein LJC43_04615, partial [Parabacteroides sp. OttesenSCG-928-G21]|nr:hypothetical protein [Parabacteroides sp. OttesenSCG-928-G21]